MEITIYPMSFVAILLETPGEVLFDGTVRFAYEQVVDFTKQLISLSVGVMGLFITFYSNLVGGGLVNRTRIYLKLALLGHLLSIAFGILSLMKLIGNVGSSTSSMVSPVYEENLTALSTIHVTLFMVSSLFLLLFAWTKINAERQSEG